MFKYIKFKLIVILLTSNLYASQKIEVFYDPFYYEDINKLLGIEEGSIIDKYKFGKVQNNGSLSDESLIQEIDKLQKKLDFEKKSVDIKVTPKNEIIEDEMVECPTCKIFISQKEAILSNGKFYCSKDCLLNK